MRVLVLCSLVATIALAEPPVNNRYLPPQQGFGPPSQSYGPPNVGQRQTEAVFRPHPSINYGAPSNRPAQRRPTNQYSPPGNGLTGSNPPRTNQRLSNQYLPPNQGFNLSPGLLAPKDQPQGSGQTGRLSDQYLPPNGQVGRLADQYLPPNGQGGRPSASHGAPEPESQYGAPGFDGNQQIGGYDASSRIGGYAGDDSNSEPASYSFEYMVKDDQSGNDFGHRESREGDRAVGVYYALLPDGRKQTVEYEADKGGYRPKISYEDTGLGPNGGYNRNAQGSDQQNYDNQGPY